MALYGSISFRLPGPEAKGMRENADLHIFQAITMDSNRALRWSWSSPFLNGRRSIRRGGCYLEWRR